MTQALNFFSSPSLHQNPPSGCRQTVFRRDTNRHLPGRCSPDSPSEGHIEPDLPLCARTFVQPGFHSETPEMFFGTNSSLTLSGCDATRNMHITCRPEEQVDRIQGACQEMLESQSTSLGKLSSLLGCMSHVARTGLWIAPLYDRDLQRQHALLLHRFGWRPRCQMILSQPSLADLRWWVSSTPHDRNSQDISPPPFDLTIRTDTSLLGWGATCNGTSTGGRWRVEEAELHINCFKLQAAILALKAFWRVGMQPSPPSLALHPPRHIVLEMDKTTAVTYVNRRGHSVTISVSTSLETVVLPGSVECGSRRRLEGIQRAHRIDASPGCLSGQSTSLLRSGDRLIRVAFEPSASSFICHDFQIPVLQQWMPLNKTGVSSRVSSSHQCCCCCLESFRNP